MYAPPSIRRVWILTFEFSEISKVGGLGEAVSLLSRELVKRGLEVTVIMPSHGIYPQHFQELDIRCCGSRYGVDGQEYPYDIGFLEGTIDGIRIILIKGRSPRTSAVLDTKPVYSYADEKACLLAHGVRCLAQRYGYPDIIHANDWHSAIAAAALRIDAENQGYALPLLYQIHLRGSPSYPWHYASEQWCGIPNTPQRVWAVTRHVYDYMQRLWDSCWGNIECFMVKLADAIALVSRSEVDLIARDYGEWVRGKCCYSYNSTSWNTKEVEELAIKYYGTSERESIRWKVIEGILSQPNVWGHIDLGNREILVVSSGRLTPQKGFDILLNAVKLLPQSIKVVILGRRVGNEDYEHYLRGLLESAWGRGIIILDDLGSSLYQLIVYLAHIYALPSRYEPFGISCIEALALGTPLVVSNVGGLGEYVVDLRSSPLGVGLKVWPENYSELAIAIQSLGYLMYYSETGIGLDKIVIRELKDLVIREPKFGIKLREIAAAYVDMLFRPRHSVNNILSCYELARQMAYYRAHT